eukprot:9448908-Pyramimonas_sp.AAC.2
MLLLVLINYACGPLDRRSGAVRITGAIAPWETKSEWMAGKLTVKCATSALPCVRQSLEKSLSRVSCRDSTHASGLLPQGWLENVQHVIGFPLAYPLLVEQNRLIHCIRLTVRTESNHDEVSGHHEGASFVLIQFPTLHQVSYEV